MRKSRVTSLFFIVILLTMSACESNKKLSDEDKWSEIERNKKIVIGINETSAPMVFRNEHNQIVGFDIDLANAVFSEYNIEPEFKSIDWSMKEDELKKGTIDLIWTGSTSSVKDGMSRSESYMQGGQVLVALKDSNIKSYKDMKEKRLGAQKSSNGLSEIEFELISLNKRPVSSIDSDFFKNEVVIFDTLDQLFLGLREKRIDALIVDKVYADYYIKKQDDYEVVLDVPLFIDSYNVGMRGSDIELENRINQSLRKFKYNGKMKEISEKWFGNDQTK